MKGLNDLEKEHGFDSAKKQTGHGTLNGRSNACQSGLTHQKAYVVQAGIDMASMLGFLLEVFSLSAEQKKTVLKDILVLKRNDKPNGEEEELPLDKLWPELTTEMTIKHVKAEAARTQRTQRQRKLLLERLAEQVTINGRNDLSKLFSDHQSRLPRL